MQQVARGVIANLKMDDKRVSVRFVNNHPDLVDIDSRQFVDKDALLTAVESALDATALTTDKLIDSMTALFTKPTPASWGPERRHRIGIFMTDGPSNDYETTLEAAERAKYSNDVNLFVVGVGREIKAAELRSIASCDNYQRYFAIPDHSKVESVARKISEKLCFSNFTTQNAARMRV